MRLFDVARGRYALAALAYALITAAIFPNLLAVVSTHIYSDLGDVLLNASILAFPLNGLAMFALARGVTGSDAGALAAGLAFAFAPYQSSQLAHVQMQMAFGMPLALLGLHQHVERGRRQGIAWFAIGWLSVALSNAYMLVFFPILVALWCAWFARGGADLSLAHQSRAAATAAGPRVKRLVPIAIAAALVMIGVAPLLWGYHVRQAAYGFARHYAEIRAFGAGLAGLAAIAHQEVLWSRWLNTTFIEAALFPGVAILALTAIGVTPRLRAAWTRRDPVVFYAAGAVAMWLIALGPEPAWNGVRMLSYGPYRLLLMLPGATSIRVPARAWLPAVLCLAVTAGAGVETLMRHARWRWVAVALAVMILAEGWFTDVARKVPEPLPAGTIPSGSLVMDLPMAATFENVPPRILRGDGRVPHHQWLQRILAATLRRAPRSAGVTSLRGVRRVQAVPESLRDRSSGRRHSVPALARRTEWRRADRGLSTVAAVSFAAPRGPSIRASSAGIAGTRASVSHPVAARLRQRGYRRDRPVAPTAQS